MKTIFDLAIYLSVRSEHVCYKRERERERESRSAKSQFVTIGLGVVDNSARRGDRMTRPTFALVMNSFTTGFAD